jgi:hypothetical protein
MIKSKAEAFSLLEETRTYYVEYARWLAVQICNATSSDDLSEFHHPDTHRAIAEHPGMVHAKLLRDEMQARGLFDGYAGGHTWIGAALRGPAFGPDFDEPEYCYEEESRNIHPKRIFWWRIVDDLAAGQLYEPPAPEQYLHARSAFTKNTGAAYGDEKHRLLALETVIITIRLQAEAQQKEHASVRGGKVFLAPRPRLSPEAIDWLLGLTEIIA